MHTNVYNFYGRHHAINCMKMCNCTKYEGFLLRAYFSDVIFNISKEKLTDMNLSQNDKLTSFDLKANQIMRNTK